MARFHLFLMGLFLVLPLFLGGCEKALFSDSAPRTQFERYDRLRGSYSPMDSPNARGGAEPDVRQRLGQGVF